MREIKFRGKRIDNGEWVYGSLSMGGGSVLDYDAHRTFIEPNTPTLARIEAIPETVGQYTGLKDKNWVEIYEGDIIEAVGQEVVKVTESYRKTKADIYNFVVCWDNSFVSWKFKHPKGIIHPDVNLREYEIIGSIHENKELLNVHSR